MDSGGQAPHEEIIDWIGMRVQANRVSREVQAVVLRESGCCQTYMQVRAKNPVKMATNVNTGKSLLWVCKAVTLH